jgi:hypothetical protein
MRLNSTIQCSFYWKHIRVWLLAGQFYFTFLFIGVEEKVAMAMSSLHGWENDTFDLMSPSKVHKNLLSPYFG